MSFTFVRIYNKVVPNTLQLAEHEQIDDTDMFELEDFDEKLFQEVKDVGRRSKNQCSGFVQTVTLENVMEVQVKQFHYQHSLTCQQLQVQDLE